MVQFPSRKSLFASCAFTLLSSAYGHFSYCPGGEGQSIKLLNLTPNHNFSAPIYVAHHKDIQVFEEGGIASPEVKALAETGDYSSLITLLNSDSVSPAICGYITGDLILPMMQEYVTINLTEKAATPVQEYGCNCDDFVISIMAKLMPSNDAFVGINSVKSYVAPTDVLDEPHAPWDNYMMPAYDAGSEANTEICADMGDCPNTTMAPSANATAGAEGYIHIYAGVLGGADLNVDKYQFMNPAALVEIHEREPTAETIQTESGAGGKFSGTLTTVWTTLCALVASGLLLLA